MYFHVLRKLEELDIPYMVIGAFAATMYGITRSTHDVDIIVNLDESHVEALASAFPSPRYYADPYQMRGAIENASTFNIIDAERAEKVDLFLLSLDLRYKPAFETRTRRTVPISGQEPLTIWVARREDVIVGKFMAWAEGRSYRHLADIYEMMVFHYLQALSGDSEFDDAYTDERIAALGEEVVIQWQVLKEAAQEFAAQQQD